MTIKNIIIFASGNGSNAENIASYFHHSNVARVKLIVSNRSSAGVIGRAEKLGIESWVVSKQDLDDLDFLDRLNSKKPDLIVLAGFLLKIPEVFIQRFQGKIINIHPSLLPKFGGKGMYGKFVHEAVIASGEKQSGISIHYVNEHYDEGKIISQHKCEVLDNDSAESLAERIHMLEYEFYPKTIEKIINDD